MPQERQRPGGGRTQRQPMRRMGTQNVNGFAAGNMEARGIMHAAHWAKLKLDVVLVTETHHTKDDEPKLDAAFMSSDAPPSRGGWRCVWSAAASRATCGVAVMIREGLQGFTVEEQYNTLPPSLPPQPPFSEQAWQAACMEGRLLALRVRWGGHNIQLACVYLPSGHVTAQQCMITHRLKPLLEAARAHSAVPVWAGDWNFVEHTALDSLTAANAARASAGATNTPLPLPSDNDRTRVAKDLHSECPGLTDVFRAMHPHSAHFTYFTTKRAAGTAVAAAGAAAAQRAGTPAGVAAANATAAAEAPSGAAQPAAGLTAQGSRIDRFYVSADWLAHVKQCRVPVKYSTSDHRVATIDILSRLSPEPGKGICRRRVSYSRRPDLVEHVQQWIAQAIQEAPASDDEFLTWWTGFKQALGAIVARTSSKARADDRAKLQPSAALVAAVDAAAAEVEAAAPGAAARYQKAQAEHADDAWQRARAAAPDCGYTWLHKHENPSPTISAILRPPLDSRTIPSLTNPLTGELVTAPRALAALMVANSARVSAAPNTDTAAVNAVLQAVDAQPERVGSTTATASLNTAAGSPSITAAQVRKALKRMAAGKAPGVDGIPVEVYKLHADVLAPLLARLFSAIGSTRRMPRDFLLGAIVYLHKKGPRCDAANYRPITLLNTDYKVLARVLADRLTPLLAATMGREQCAYLPGRRGGEAVWLLQLLPEALRRARKEAAVVFMDFAKAFDTVSRPFMFAVMRKVGVAEGLVQWAELLLSDTRAVAVVNGHVSKPAEFAAGVRQGCPLSPLLYLFVAHSLLCWLKQQNLGIEVGLRKLTAAQFADDCNAFLAKLQQAVPFHAAMLRFGDASGQRLNTSKTHIVRMGELRDAVPPGLPFTIVTSAETLGVRFSNEETTPPAALEQYWAPRIAAARANLERIRKMPLSSFGKAISISSYGVSKLLYFAEFMGPPPPKLLEPLQRLAAAVIDKRTPGKRGLTGIPRAVIEGRPEEGGFGQLPFQRHVRGRLAAWAKQLLTAPLRYDTPDEAPLFVSVARAILSSVSHGATPLALLPPRQHQHGEQDALWSVSMDKAYSQAALSVPAQRLFGALRCLPAPSIDTSGLQYGTWCRDAPLFFNPLITYTTSPAATQLEQRSEGLKLLKWGLLRTVQDLAELHAADAAAVKAVFGEIPATAIARLTAPGGSDSAVAALQPWLQHCDNAKPNRRTLKKLRLYHKVRTLSGTCNGDYYQARDEMQQRLAQRGASLQPRHERHEQLQRMWAAERHILRCVSFTHPRVAAGRQMQQLTVRELTAMQQDAAAEQRRQRSLAFVTEAMPAGEPAAALITTRNTFLATLPKVWALRWENRHKEVLWRLAVDGVPLYGSARFTRNASGPPPTTCCSGARAGRRHQFWDCPVAAAVRRELERCMPRRQHRPLARRHVWLLLPPKRGDVEEQVWHVVCLAALNAMNHGQRMLTALRMGGGSLSGAAARRCRRHNTAPTAPTPPAPTATDLQRQQASAAAVAYFWSQLRSFVALYQRSLPKTWPPLPAAHPFIGCVTAGDSCSLRVNAAEEPTITPTETTAAVA